MTYASTHTGTNADARANTTNPVHWRYEPTKPVAAASMATAPRVGVTIAAAPAANPPTSGCHGRRCDSPMLASAAQAATIENSVVNQWWLICVQAPCDMTAHPITRSAEVGA